MGLEVVEFRGKPVNDDAVDLLEALLARVKSGEAVAVAFVEVRPGGDVATAFSKSNHYHYLTSGAARLLSRLANEA